jgi:uncharacterized protein (TIGR02001 family)
MKTIQKTALALAASTLLATTAFAADTPTNPEDAGVGSAIAANVSVTNDYRYRGISQSNFQPAVQGGFDYAHESGFYIGNWNSSISWISDANPGVSAPVEMDFYAGFKKDLIAEGFASDIGVLQYYYPMNGGPVLATSPNTTEIYAAQNFTAGPVNGFVKFSYAVTTLFGFYGSTGSNYSDLTLNYDTGIWGITANAHVGYQSIAGNNASGASNGSLYSYTDWKLGLTKDLGAGLSLSAAYVDTNANSNNWSYNGKNLGGATGIVTLTKAF